MKSGNAISLVRIPLLLIHVLVAGFLSPEVNVAIVIANYVLDMVDGFVSRRRGGTEYGEFMDISVDRIITLGYFAYHLFMQRVHILFFLLILVRNIKVDYISYFYMIEGKKKERHKMTSGIHYWIYTSRASRIVNGFIQILISSWGFVSAVPVWLQVLFIINSYVRALPSINKARSLV